MSTYKTYEITPNEILKRGVDWTSELLGILANSQWITEPGITITGPGFDDSTTSAFFSIPGGVADELYKATNRVQAEGETLERTFQFKVVEEKTR